MLDLNAAAAAALDERLQAESVIWLTTVDADGQPQSSPEQPPVHQAAAYLAKYRSGITSIGSTPEKMAAEYSTALRVTPTRVRVF